MRPHAKSIHKGPATSASLGSKQPVGAPENGGIASADQEAPLIATDPSPESVLKDIPAAADLAEVNEPFRKTNRVARAPEAGRDESEATPSNPSTHSKVSGAKQRTFKRVRKPRPARDRPFNSVHLDTAKRPSMKIVIDCSKRKQPTDQVKLNTGKLASRKRPTLMLHFKKSCNGSNSTVISSARSDQKAPYDPNLELGAPPVKPLTSSLKVAKRAEKSVEMPKAVPSRDVPHVERAKARYIAPRLTRVQRAEQEENRRQQEKSDMYTPNIDPMVEPKDNLPDPFQFSKMMYTGASSAHFQRTLGEIFPDIRPVASNPSKVNWPKDATMNHTKEMEAWSINESKWAKVGSHSKNCQNSWSFRPAPKNIEELETWLDSHGHSLTEDRFLQKQGYVTEYLKPTQQVKEDRKFFEPHPGALRIDDDDPKRFMRHLLEYAAVKNIDDQEDAGNMRRIKSQPANDTIEYDSKIDSECAASIIEATDAMNRGHVSGASVSSFRWSFNEGSQSDLSGHIAKSTGMDNAASELAALALMELSVESSMAVQHKTLSAEPAVVDLLEYSMEPSTNLGPIP